MWGYSAGAQIALVTTLSANADPAKRVHCTHWTADDSRWEQIPPVQAVVGGGSPCEFNNLPPENVSLSYWLGGSRTQRPDQYTAASPTSWIDADDPPVQLLHGTADVIVPLASAEAMDRAAQRVNAQCELISFEGDGHISTFTNREVLKTAVMFLSQKLGVEPEATRSQ